METILNVKEVTTKLGRKMIFVVTAKRDHWVTSAQWIAAGLSYNFALYVGGTITADYFKKGEKLFSREGQPDRFAESDDVILRDYVVTPNAEIVAKAYAAEVQQKEQLANDMNLLFRRKRDAVQQGAMSDTQTIDTKTGAIETPQGQDSDPVEAGA